LTDAVRCSTLCALGRGGKKKAPARVCGSGKISSQRVVSEGLEAKRLEFAPAGQVEQLEVSVRRILTMFAATAMATLLMVPITLANASAVRAKLQLRHTSVGTILVNSRGFTLYAFSRDARNKDACQKIKHCLKIWPALATSGKPIAGRGVHQSLIGTIRLASGARQVTYAGHPLYTYIADTAPGQTFYVNIFQFGGFWPAVNGAGHELK
jgi:predicted lipoprotein with Yx(FWY)xxD motif